MANAIEVKNLSYGYEVNHDVIKDISFNIKAGSYTVILGHNGSGKSTLAKLIIGLLAMDSGEIKVNGLVLSPKTVYQIRDQVGIVFQNPDNQFIGSTVRDDIAFGLENHCVDPQKMEDIIMEFATKVGMVKHLDKEPSHLSGGQKQRVAIAGVLAMSPSILILDEATSMLDPKGKRSIKELIRRTKELIPDITIVSITHDVEEACLADEVIILNQGKIYAIDTPSVIFKDSERLTELNLDVPFAYKLKAKLEQAGIKVDSLDIEEMVKEICQ